MSDASSMWQTRATTVCIRHAGATAMHMINASARVHVLLCVSLRKLPYGSTLFSSSCNAQCHMHSNFTITIRIRAQIRDRARAYAWPYIWHHGVLRMRPHFDIDGYPIACRNLLGITDESSERRERVQQTRSQPADDMISTYSAVRMRWA